MPVDGIVSQDDKDDRTHSLLVYERESVFNGNEVAGFIERAFYYDYMGRIIQTVMKDERGCCSRYSTKYDFMGNILAKCESHQTDPETNTADTLKSFFTYDHRNRLLSEITTLNASEPAVIKYGYDELGKLISKTYGEGANSVTDQLKYNIQGWLTEQNNPLFEMKLRYFDLRSMPPYTDHLQPLLPTTTPSYTGNITEWEWRHKENDMLDIQNTYAFTYDKLSRLTDTKHYENGSATDVDSFVERGFSYDRNSNILTLERFGATAGTVADNFNYVYDGNKLITLKTTTNPIGHAYIYDANGNCTTDGLNGLNLQYNFLNLVGEIKSPDHNAPLATYRWLADGTKIGVTDNIGRGFDYWGSLIYTRNGGNLALESASFGGGRFRAKNTQTGLEYIPNYFITDHLGSTRVVFEIEDDKIQVVNRSNYYPYGLKWTGQDIAASDNRWLYNGKELQTTGLPDDINVLDYGARMYDPRTSKWLSTDPLSEKYYSWSPFNYTLGNPIKYIDPTGKEINLYEVASYQNRMSYFSRGTINNDMTRMIGGFEVSPYLNKDENIIGWSAFRNGRIQYVMDSPDDIDSFSKNASALGVAADLFYRNGTPSQGQIAMVAGDIGSGLLLQWGEALLNPGYYFYIANILGAAAITTGNATTNVYRIYGGDSSAGGYSWTPVNPNGISNFRSIAGLPSGGASGAMNTGQFVIEGSIQNRYIIQSRPAYPLDGNPGGLREFIIEPSKVNIKRVSGANPEF